MIQAITSVTLAVSDLDSSLRLFRDRLGLAVVIDAHASVGLLAAWRYPVHESVRLVELAAPDGVLGRIRLAVFEDAEGIPQAPTRLGGGASHGAAAQVAGAIALISRVDGEDAFILCEPDGLPQLVASTTKNGPVAVPGTAPHDAGAPCHSVWVLAGPSAIAERFYGEALGFSAAGSRPSLPEHVDSAIRSILEVPSAGPLQATAYHTGGERRDAIVLVRSSTDPDPPPARPRRVGEPGINLVSCECANLDELTKRLSALALEPLALPTHVALPDGRPGKVMVVRGPSEELFEFIEPGD
ncbi:MAG TPA: hypothetical protein VMG11_01130 [Steroidobacteraceae bacterium]|nr:hypothetical protein [Steroidobacteraceae bacterium]